MLRPKNNDHPKYIVQLMMLNSRGDDPECTKVLRDYRNGLDVEERALNLIKAKTKTLKDMINSIL